MSREVGEALRRMVAERAYGVCEYCLGMKRTCIMAVKWTTF
jgi:hypothetical protein